MTIFLDPTGRPNYGIGICGRCSRKFFLDELFDDPNTPGLKVCAADMDEYDPYRLPARTTERISLPFTRPDTPLTFDINDVSNANRSGPVFLTGAFSTPNENLSWTPSIDPNLGYRLYRSVDGGGYVLIASPSSVTLAYSDGPLDRLLHTYSYYVSYIDFAGVESRPSNIVTVAKGLPASLVAVTISPIANQVAVSLDNGLTFTGYSAAEANPWQDVCFAPEVGPAGRLVAVASTGVNRVMYSDDGGQTWTAALASNNRTWTRVVRDTAHGLFVAVANDGIAAGQVMTSPDGAVWTDRASAQARAWGSLIYVDAWGTLIAGVDSPSAVNCLMRSTDGGLTWALVTLGTAGTISCMAYDSARSILLGRSQLSFYGIRSVDGVAFTLSNGVLNSGCRCMAASPNVAFVVLGPGDSNQERNTTGAITAWAGVAIVDEQWLAMVFAQGQFVAISTSSRNSVTSSDGGITWITHANALPAAGTWNSMCKI